MNREVKGQIQEVVEENKRQAFIRCEQDRLHDDLIGLYQDILAETPCKTKDMLFDFTGLLQQELDLFKPEQAYEFALKSTECSAANVEKAYILSVESDSTAISLQSNIHAAFNRLAGILGDKHSLIADYTQCYRKVFGAITSNLSPIIELGISNRLHAEASSNGYRG